MSAADRDTSGNRISVLLTGGSGFLGRAIVREFLSTGCPVDFSLLRIFDLQRYDGPTDDRIEMVIGDVRDEDALFKACEGIDAVIHAAAVVDWGTRPESEVFAVNFTGTENVVKVCKERGIRFLVYTSSLDAIYTGKPMVNIDETVPYPAQHPNMYCRSKALAEQLVMNGCGDNFYAAILRPSDIYGPGDPFHIGSLIDMAKGGFYVRLGNGSAKSQHVFVGNMAIAHLQLLEALASGNRKVTGNAYFITDAPPSNFFTFFDSIVAGAGYRIRPKNLWIPRRIAYAMGATAEFFALLIRPFVKYNPKFSRFAVIYTCSDFTFTAKKAEKDFGFKPKYSHRESFDLTVSHYNRTNTGIRA